MMTVMRKWVLATVNNGWVKLHRKIVENIFLMNDDRAFIVFTKLLLYCNSNGQYADGRRRMGETFNMNPNTLYKVLQRLEEQQLISIVSNRRYSTFTICKWSTYQQYGNHANTLPVTNGQPAGNQPVTNGQHLNKNKNKNKKPAALSLKIDEDLAAKEKAAKTRKLDGSGYKKALQIAEAIKLKKKVVA